jgi:hypothetical protein
MDTIFPDDIQMMYEIKMKMDILAKQVEINKNDTIEFIKKINEIDEDDNEKTKAFIKLNKLKEKWENFKHIHDCVKTYLEVNCQHNFIDDYIDTSPESGMNIRYCMHCYKNGN